MTFSQIAFVALALLFGTLFTLFGVATVFGKHRARSQREGKANDRVIGCIILTFGFLWLAIGALVWVYSLPVEGPSVDVEVSR